MDMTSRLGRLSTRHSLIDQLVQHPAAIIPLNNYLSLHDLHWSCSKYASLLVKLGRTLEFIELRFQA